MHSFKIKIELMFLKVFLKIINQREKINFIIKNV